MNSDSKEQTRLMEDQNALLRRQIANQEALNERLQKKGARSNYEHVNRHPITFLIALAVVIGLAWYVISWLTS